MTSLRVGDDFYINADSIEIVQRSGTRPAEREVARAKSNGTLYNATRGGVTRSVVTLKSGWVVVSSGTPDTLVSRPLIHPPTRPSTRGGAPENDDFHGGFGQDPNPK